MKEIQQEVQGHSWPRLLLEVLAGGTPVTEEQEQDESRILGGYIYVYNMALYKVLRDIQQIQPSHL